MKTILIIEDNYTILENVAELLELYNYNVLKASNGKEGIQKALDYNPDLIICDISMPELDGYGVLKILKHRGLNCPFIFLTAKADKADFRKGMNIGATDYLVKPFDELELLQVIELRLKVSAEQIVGGNPLAGIGSQEKYSSDWIEKKLFEGKDTRAYKKHSYLIEENSSFKYIYYVKEGVLKIAQTHYTDKDFILNFAKVGDFIGAELFFSQIPTYPVHAYALSDIEVYRLTKDEFQAKLDEHIELYKFFLELKSRKLTFKCNRLISLAYASIRKRMADCILNFESNNYLSQEIVTISREQLAQYVGATKESVTRTLSDFKRENLIELDGKRILIRDEKQLREVL